VTDHRINLTLYDLSNIIDGDIQKIIDELQLVDNTERLKESGDTF
ncbi:peptide chain release factor 1, partial [Flavobacteriaceae bacterium]|nr:peptide chain release factor 1 [Flavobacteriaceae bacterium]